MEPSIKYMTDDMQNIVLGVLFGIILCQLGLYVLTVKYWKKRYDRMKSRFVKYLSTLDMENQKLQGKRRVKKSRRDYEDVFEG